MERGVEQSYVAAIQVVNDRCQVPLSSAALSFYSPHIAALNFPGKRRREQVTNNKALVVYLPVFYDTTSVNDAFSNLNPLQKGYERAEPL